MIVGFPSAQFSNTFVLKQLFASKLSDFPRYKRSNSQNENVTARVRIIFIKIKSFSIKKSYGKVLNTCRINVESIIIQEYHFQSLKAELFVQKQKNRTKSSQVNSIQRRISRYSLTLYRVYYYISILSLLVERPCTRFHPMCLCC